MTEVKRVFKVNGKPFFPLGASPVIQAATTTNIRKQLLKQSRYCTGIPWKSLCTGTSVNPKKENTTSQVWTA